MATALESSRGGSAISLTDPGVLREVIGASLYLAVIAVIGLALGALLRRTAVGLSVFAAVFFVVPVVTNYLPHSIQAFVPYLPSNAGGDIRGAGKMFGGHQLGPWNGFASCAATRSCWPAWPPGRCAAATPEHLHRPGGYE